MTRARFVRSFGYAIEGIVQAFREGRNFKVQSCFAVAAIVLGIVFPIEPYEWAIIFVCIGVVLGGECLNTSEYNELAKRAKDCAAGAVLLCSIASLFVAAFLFLPRMLVAFGLL